MSYKPFGATGLKVGPLDEEAWTRIDALFPGPGGPASEAYAW